MIKKYSSANVFCSKCKYFSQAENPCIQGYGNPNASVLVIGPSPTVSDDATGECLTGALGDAIKNYLHQYDYYYINAVKCKVPTGKKLSATAKKSCYAFTIDKILDMKPKLIIALGEAALSQITGVSVDIKTVHGKIMFHPEFQCNILPTYSPMFLIQKGQDGETMYKKHFIEDLKVGLRYVGGRRYVPNNRGRSLKDQKDISDYLDKLLSDSVSAFALDLETTSLKEYEAKITDITLCHAPNESVHIKWEDLIPHFDSKFRKLLGDKSKTVIYFNGSYDETVLLNNGFKVDCKIFDAQIAYQKLTMSFEGGGALKTYSLKVLAWFFTDCGGYEHVLDSVGGIAGHQGVGKKVSKVVAKKKVYTDPTLSESELTSYQNRLEFCDTFLSGKKLRYIESLGLTPIEYYTLMDGDVTYRLYMRFNKMLEKDGLDEAFHKIDMPLLRVLNHMSFNGMLLDVEYMDKLKIKLENNAREALFLFMEELKLDEETFNLNSVPQLQDLLYKKLKIKKNKNFLTPKGAPSTDAKAIEFFSKEHPVLKYIIDYRHYNKMISTYIDGFFEHSDAYNRIHSKFSQVATATSRLGSSRPNVQNIPRDNQFRNMIIPRSGWKIVNADLSQAEIRVLAQETQDANLINAFNNNYDVHSATAALILGIPYESVDKDNNEEHNKVRNAAKTIVFGIMYGRGAHSIAEQLGITIREAQNYIDDWFAAYPSVQPWINQTIREAHEKGYVTTLYGRRRYLPDIYSTHHKGFIRSGAERQAVNTKIQSAANDITSQGLIKLHQHIEDAQMDSKIILTVHDEINVESPECECDIMSDLITKCLTENIYKISVPLVADPKIMDRWEK